MIVISGNTYLVNRAGNSQQKPLRYTAKHFIERPHLFARWNPATAEQIEASYPEDWKKYQIEKEAEEAKDLKKQTKEDLLALAKKEGIEVPDNSTKQDIIVSLLKDK